MQEDPVQISFLTSGVSSPVANQNLNPITSIVRL